MLVGDSVAYTLFPGLVDHERPSDMYFLNVAVSGCALDITASATHNDGQPSYPTHLGSACQWPRVWPTLIGRACPQLVVALWGLWDLYDVKVNNVWLRVGTPSWSRHMEDLINQAVDVLAAHGARVVILTTPYTLSVAAWRGRRVERGVPRGRRVASEATHGREHSKRERRPPSDAMGHRPLHLARRRRARRRGGPRARPPAAEQSHGDGTTRFCRSDKQRRESRESPALKARIRDQRAESADAILARPTVRIRRLHDRGVA